MSTHESSRSASREPVQATGEVDSSRDEHEESSGEESATESTAQRGHASARSEGGICVHKQVPEIERRMAAAIPAFVESIMVGLPPLPASLYR